MLAMMHVLIRDGLTDEPWIAAHTTGFAELVDHVADWTPATRRRGVRARRRPDRTAGHRLRHDPTGSDPRPDRCRAPPQRGDVLPLAGRAAGARRRLAVPRWRTVAECRHLSGRADRRQGADPARPPRRPPTALAEHEPARRHPHRRHPRPAGPRHRRVERQSRRGGPQRRGDPSGTATRRPVHRRPRAVPHRHGPLRRHRPAGDDADRAGRRRRRVGPPVARLERQGDRATRARRAATPSCSAGSPGRWATPSRRCSTTTPRCSPRRSAAPSTSTNCGRPAGSASPTPTTVGRSAMASSRRHPARSSWSASALRRARPAGAADLCRRAGRARTAIPISLPPTPCS